MSAKTDNLARHDEAARYELRDHTVGSSRKQFHVWDRKAEREVFHTDSWARADQVIRQAGSGEVTQHLKDYGHHFVVTDKRGKCGACKR
ncbi:hypothetical protein EPN42_10935 [bacterium]|nr:MAG: hypothetical protein EPN42_10935 [bacterium]